jgi:hypothetical protein
LRGGRHNSAKVDVVYDTVQRLNDARFGDRGVRDIRR